MLTAFDIITTIIDDVLGILFISKFYPFRDKINIRIPICVGILAVHSFLNVYLIYHMYFMKSLSFIAAFVLCTVIMLKCDKFKFLLLNALCVSIDYLSETLSVLLVAASRQKSLFALADSGELKTSMYLLSTLIVLILYFLLDMIVRRKQEKRTFDNKLLSSYEVISFLIIVILQIIIIFGLASVFPDKRLNTFLGIFSVGFCVLNFGLYFIFTRLADVRRIEYENQLMKQQSEMQLKAYEGLSEQYNESLRIVHDMGDVDALCQRIVIIDKGKMLYDNDIEHLKNFFGSYRTLKIRIDGDLKQQAEKIQHELSRFSVSADDEWISILVDEEKSKVMEVLSQLQQSYEIRDMQLEEISTEEVIKKIYEEGVQ